MDNAAATRQSLSDRARVLLAVRSHQNAIALKGALEDELLVCIEASSVAEITREIAAGVDMLIMSEVILQQTAMQQIAEALLAQPQWSNIATILLLKGKKRSPNFQTFWETVAHRRSVILMQAPIKPTVFVSIVRACWQDRKRQYALKAALNDLSQSNRALESFSYTAAHELRSPLGILNSSFSILERTDLTPKQMQFVDMGLRTVRSMDQTLQALLDYGKLSADRERFKRVDMNAVVAQAAEGLQALVDKRHAQISHETLPNVCGHSQLLIQLVSNLIKNAIVHNASSTPKVTIRAEQAEDRWIIHVVDNGPGIRKENQKKIFALFDRAGKSRVDGSGIGLALCRRIVKQHDGKIKVRSNPDGGSDFYFDLASV